MRWRAQRTSAPCTHALLRSLRAARCALHTGLQAPQMAPQAPGCCAGEPACCSRAAPRIGGGVADRGQRHVARRSAVHHSGGACVPGGPLHQHVPAWRCSGQGLGFCICCKPISDDETGPSRLCSMAKSICAGKCSQPEICSASVLRSSQGPHAGPPKVAAKWTCTTAVRIQNSTADGHDLSSRGRSPYLCWLIDIDRCQQCTLALHLSAGQQVSTGACMCQ